MRHPLPLLALLLASVAAGQDAPRQGFLPDTTQTVLRFDLRDGRAYVAARIGERALTFLVDPAGANVIAPRRAAELGLARDAAAGAAAGVPVVRPAAVELGGFTLRDAPFHLLELERWRAIEGEPIDGVLGAEAFERVVLTLDYAARLLTLTEPGAFRAPERATRLPLRFVEGLPLVAATVDGRHGEFAVEPATRGPLTLHGGFVRQHGLLEQRAHGHETVVGWGLGGPVRGYATRVAEFEWDGWRAPQVVAFLQTADRADVGARAVAGTIGGALLARFTVSFDAVGRALLLEPNAALATPDQHDRAGLWLNHDGEDLIIDALQPNGPAARAQLQPHDRIVAVDGVPATQLSLAGLRQRLATTPAGTRVKVTARRDGKVVFATVVLADLVPATAPPSTP